MVLINSNKGLSLQTQPFVADEHTHTHTAAPMHNNTVTYQCVFPVSLSGLFYSVRLQDEGLLAGWSPWKLDVCESEWEWEILLIVWCSFSSCSETCLLHSVLQPNQKLNSNLPFFNCEYSEATRVLFFLF